VRVLGVDGCVGGWIVVELTDDSVSDCRFAASFAEVVASDAAVIGVDIPLGEPPEVRRAADPAARKHLAGGRPNSVFDAPPWATLTAETHAEANGLARALTGRGLAAQSWALRAKILDATPHWRADSRRVHEVHPEVSFRTLAGQVVTTSKKTWAGHRARVAMLRGAGIELPDDAGMAGTRGTPDDVLDAAVVAWTAARLARGEAKSLPSPPERDVDGNPVAIWY
jgi:predicted RNase H-like nuclease